jgi:serine protease Do
LEFSKEATGRITGRGKAILAATGFILLPLSFSLLTQEPPHMQAMKSLKKSAAVIAIGGVSIAGWSVGSNLVDNVRFAHAQDVVQQNRQDLATSESLSTVFRKVGKAVEPSVVNIQVLKKAGGASGNRALPFDEDMLKRFFPDRDGDGKPDLPEGFGNGGGNDDGLSPFDQMGTGSGVIMEVAGSTAYILTNNHVAGGATEITVTLADGRRLEGAKVLGADPKTDLAVVRVEADRLISAQWGDSDLLEKGDWIMAFGSPFGYIGSMTHGIVSALNRQAGILGQNGYENFIQVDAPINPGNSGGPLVNTKGEVVGINTAIASRSGSFSGIGFAIPSNQAKFVYKELKEKGKVTRGWLGVSISDVSRDVEKAKSFGYKGDKGVLVEQTFEKTPAYNKLQPGDIVTEMNGKQVDNVQSLRNAIAATSPGTELTMKLFRDGKQETVKLTIGEQPEDPLLALGKGGPGLRGPAATGQSDAGEALGMKFETPSAELNEKFSLGESVKEGAVITEVAPTGPAAKEGLRPGDVITSVNGVRVKDAKSAAEAIGKAEKGKGIRLYVESADGKRFVFVKPAAGK